MNKVFTLIIGFILFSCNSRYSETNTSEYESLMIKEEQENTSVSKEKDVIDYQNLNHPYIDNIKHLDSIYGYTPYVAIFDSTALFYVSSQKNILTNSKIGLIDQNYNVLLPQEYDFIFNPNVIAVGLIAIQYNNKIGLFNYKSGILIEPQFDFIFPNKAQNKVTAMRDKKLYSIDENMEIIAESDSISFSILDLISTDLRFPNERTTPLYSIYNSHWKGFKNEEYLFCPNYLNQFKFLNKVIRFLTSGNNSENLNLSIEKQFDINVQTKGVIVKTKSYNWSEGAADLFSNHYSYSLITYWGNNEIVSTNKLLSCENSKVNDFSYITDSADLNLLQVKFQNTDDRFSTYTDYRFFRIDNDGRINKLSTNRKYGFTKFVRIDSSYFWGRYEKYIGRTDLKDKGRWEEHYEITLHLSLEDLDVMRNEIYADYGYKFKNTKWQEYFKNYPHYKPKYDNVDKLLTRIDKQNIQFIMQYKKQLIKGDIKYLFKSTETRVESSAG